MYIFWDNSNIHYAGLNQVRPMLEPTAKKELYRTYFSTQWGQALESWNKKEEKPSENFVKDL